MKRSWCFRESDNAERKKNQNPDGIELKLIGIGWQMQGETNLLGKCRDDVDVGENGGERRGYIYEFELNQENGEPWDFQIYGGTI